MFLCRQSLPGCGWGPVCAIFPAEKNYDWHEQERSCLGLGRILRYMIGVQLNTKTHTVLLATMWEGVAEEFVSFTQN